MIEPGQARYRSAVALHRLAKALGIELRPEEEEYSCLERLASQAERWARFDSLFTEANSIRLKAYREGYGNDEAMPWEGER